MVVPLKKKYNLTPIKYKNGVAYVKSHTVNGEERIFINNDGYYNLYDSDGNIIGRDTKDAIFWEAPKKKVTGQSIPEITVVGDKSKQYQKEEAGPSGIQRAPDDHMAALDRDRRADAITEAKVGGLDKLMVTLMATGIAPVAASSAPFTVAEAAAALKPGGSFWNNPMTKGFFESLLLGKSADEGVKRITGHSWGENVGGLIERTTGYNPNNGWFGRMLTDMSNPFYYTPYSVVKLGVKNLGNSIASNTGKALNLFNSPLTGNWTRIGNYEYRFDPNITGANAFFKPQRRRVSLIVNDYGNPIYGNIIKLYNDVSNKPISKIVNRDTNGNKTDLLLHTLGVVKTATTMPAPKGFTKRDLVIAAALHDIGKIVLNKEHGAVGADILTLLFPKDIIVGTPLYRAIKYHMDPSFGKSTSLRKALLFADVARGVPYREAKYKIPYLLYKRDLPKIEYPNIPLKLEIEEFINPILKFERYPTIDPNSSFEDALAHINRYLLNQRTFWRGLRPNNLVSTLQMLFEPKKISVNRKSGRLGFLDTTLFLRIDPKKFGTVYFGDKGVANGYASDKNHLFSIQLPLNVPYLPGMSLREYMSRNALDFYKLSGIRSFNEQPFSDYHMYLRPAILQKGIKSVQENLPYYKIRELPEILQSADRLDFPDFDTWRIVQDRIGNLSRGYIVLPYDKISPLQFGSDVHSTFKLDPSLFKFKLKSYINAALR